MAHAIVCCVLTFLSYLLDHHTEYWFQITRFVSSQGGKSIDTWKESEDFRKNALVL
jgi:hypothetical protein